MEQPPAVGQTVPDGREKQRHRCKDIVFNFETSPWRQLELAAFDGLVSGGERFFVCSSKAIVARSALNRESLRPVQEK
jgi:hypothetical protein